MLKFKLSSLLKIIVLGCVLGAIAACEWEKPGGKTDSSTFFKRVASFAVCSQVDEKCQSNTETSAEIVAVSKSGNTLIYTDSPGKGIGFIDIQDPKNPKAMGVLPMPGEPTSVAVYKNFALVAVNTSKSFTEPSGSLVVVDIGELLVRKPAMVAATRAKTVAQIPLDGQPDSIAVSPSERYAAIAIENERDEAALQGRLPQLPPGSLAVLKLFGSPDTWRPRYVNFSGMAERFPSDPEPEYVDINKDDIAVLSFQENNHIALVDLKTADVIKHFSAGLVNLENVDITEETPARISPTQSLTAIPREPDGVAWLDDAHFVSADEGDYQGGSRGYTIFNVKGDIVFTSGSALEHAAIRLGHYPDSRSADKGNEPENVEVGIFSGHKFVFVASERSSLIFVYKVVRPDSPTLWQILPAGLAPEGVLAIPSRNLLVVASEKDDRKKNYRSVVTIYQYGATRPAYPTLVSANGDDGLPIAFGALSGLASDPNEHETLYAVSDKSFQSSGIFTIDIGSRPATLTKTLAIHDTFQKLGFPPNHDGGVNLDIEGISVARAGGFWLAVESGQKIGLKGRSANTIIKLSAKGDIDNVYTLPENTRGLATGFGGVSEFDGKVIAIFKRPWVGEQGVRIAVLNPVSRQWQFYLYPLDRENAIEGARLSLSAIESLGKNKFLVLEEDKQFGPDSVVKRLYMFDLDNTVPMATLNKTLYRDLIPRLQEEGGLGLGKIEGLARGADGSIWLVNDNNAVVNHSGETQLIQLPGPTGI